MIVTVQAWANACERFPHSDVFGERETESAGVASSMATTMPVRGG